MRGWLLLLRLEIGRGSGFAEEALSLGSLGEGKVRNEAEEEEEEEEEEESDLRWRKEGDGDDNVASVGFMARVFFLFW